jgi:hypothetical protein
MSYLEALAYARQLDDPQQGLFARTAAEKWACLLVYLETKALAAPPAAAQAAAAPRMVTVRHYNVDGTETLHQRPAASPAPAAEADDASRPDIIERLTYHEYERDDMTLDDVLDYLASGWKKVHGRTERQLILQLCALLAARPAAPLSEVKS